MLKKSPIFATSMRNPPFWNTDVWAVLATTWAGEKTVSPNMKFLNVKPCQGSLIEISTSCYFMLCGTFLVRSKYMGCFFRHECTQQACAKLRGFEWIFGTCFVKIFECLGFEAGFVHETWSRQPILFSLETFGYGFDKRLI